MGDERRACGHRALPLAVSQRARWEWLAGWPHAVNEGGGRAGHAALGRTALPPLSLDRLRLLREIGPAPNDNCVSCLSIGRASSGRAGRRLSACGRGCCMASQASQSIRERALWPMYVRDRVI